MTVTLLVTAAPHPVCSLSRADLEQVVAEWPDLAEELSALGEWVRWWNSRCCGMEGLSQECLS